MSWCLSEHLGCFISLKEDKCICLKMLSDFLVQKMSRSIGKMKLCWLYHPKYAVLLVLILGKSPYKDQNGKNCPYLILILDFNPYFEEIEERIAYLIKLLVCQMKHMYISLLKWNNHYLWVGPFNFNHILKFAFKIMVISKCLKNKNRSLFLISIVLIRTK